MQAGMQLTKEQSDIMGSEGHLLVVGGPGSGKTTVSILKAAQIAKDELRPGQRILFLSFARATISRVIESIEYEQDIPREQKQRIEVNTYHAFFWQILKTHGYLLGLPRNLSILTPPAEAIALSAIRSLYSVGAKSGLTNAEKEARKKEREAAEANERLRLAHEEGRICFDLFDRYVSAVLHGSDRVRRIIATMYPIIILDEFQDTNAGQWNVVQELGQYSRLLALADPEQRIYDWIGADPERLNHFKAAYQPTEFDLHGVNHRSAGTDIALFGNHVLTGKFRDEPYVGVYCEVYEPVEKAAMTKLVVEVYGARVRLIAAERKDWSIAILVATKKMTRIVSDALHAPPAGLTKVHHVATIEMEAAILGAEVIAFLMQPDTDGQHFAIFLGLMLDYFRGKGGGSPTKGDLEEALKLQRAYDEMLSRRAAGRPIHGKSVLIAMLSVYEQTRSAILTGNPDQDWLLIRNVLAAGTCARLKDIAEETRNLRLLQRGTQLRDRLSQDWRDHGFYANALAITRQAFVREHFSTNSKPETGVVVMNMHKAKGKQFDEVIIFDAWPRMAKKEIVANPARIVRDNARANITDQACQNFRVSITRAKLRVTILTPKNNPCVLLLPRE